MLAPCAACSASSCSCRRRSRRTARRPAADPLAVKGARLIDGQGRTVVLHGVNVVYKLAPYTPDFTRADARRLRGWGMNAIRLGVSWRALEPTRGVLDTVYVARVRRLVRLAGAEGLWVLIDMHQDLWSERYGGEGAPDWATLDDGQPFTSPRPFPYAYLQPAVGRSFTSFWTQPRRDPHRLRERLREAWPSVLAREDAVIGYDAHQRAGVRADGRPLRRAAAARGCARSYLRPSIASSSRRCAAPTPARPTFYEDWLTTDFGYPILGRTRLPLEASRRWA